MMLRIVFIALISGVFIQSVAQEKELVVWEVNAVRLNNQEAVIAFQANLPDSVHIYACSTHTDSVSPTRFVFMSSDDFELLGPVAEGNNSIATNDPVFGIPLKRYLHSASFTQRIRLKPSFTVVKGYISYTAVTGREINPVRMVNFSVAVKVRD